MTARDIAMAYVRETARTVLNAIDSHADHRVIYHADVDGLCAAACLAQLIGSRSPQAPSHAWVPTSEFHFTNWADDFPPTVGTLTITADINFSSRPAFLAQLDALYGSSLVIIDDHLLNEPPPDRLKLINPNLGLNGDTPIDLASSLYAYHLAINAKVKVPEWVPVLGLYFDRQLATYASLFRDTLSRQSIDQAIRTLSTIYLDDTTDHSTDRSFELMVEAIAADADWPTFCEMVQADPHLIATETANQAEVELRYENAVRDLWNLGRWDGQLIQFYMFSSRLQVANIVASRLRGRNASGIYIALRHGACFAQVELRLGTEVQGIDLVSFLRTLSDRVPFTNFGGHPRAAGGAVSIENVPILLNELQAMVTS